MPRSSVWDCPMPSTKACWCGPRRSSTLTSCQNWCWPSTVLLLATGWAMTTGLEPWPQAREILSAPPLGYTSYGDQDNRCRSHSVLWSPNLATGKCYWFSIIHPWNDKLKTTDCTSRVFNLVRKKLVVHVCFCSFPRNLTTVNCEVKNYFVCQKKSLDQEPDFNCPVDYYSYKGECIKISRDRKTYEGAQMDCALSGSIVNTPTNEGEFEFWRSLAKSQSKSSFSYLFFGLYLLQSSISKTNVIMYWKNENIALVICH